MSSVKKIYLLANEETGTFSAAIEKTETRILADVTPLLNHVLASQPQVIPLSISDRIYVGFHQGIRYLLAALPFLRFNVSYTILSAAQPDIMVPVWRGLEEKAPFPAVRVNLTWTPPEGCIPWMIFDGDAWYLIATVATLEADGASKRYMRKLPVGNLYSDAKLCMGDAYRPLCHMGQDPKIGLVDLVTFVKASREFLEESTWNGDLVTNARMPASDAIFRWKLEGKETVGIVPDTKTFLDSTREIAGPWADCLLFALSMATSSYGVKPACVVPSAEEIQIPTASL